MAVYDFQNMLNEMWSILEALFEGYKRDRSGGGGMSVHHREHASVSPSQNCLLSLCFSN